MPSSRSSDRPGGAPALQAGSWRNLSTKQVPPGLCGRLWMISKAGVASATRASAGSGEALLHCLDLGHGAGASYRSEVIGRDAAAEPGDSGPSMLSSVAGFVCYGGASCPPVFVGDDMARLQVELSPDATRAWSGVAAPHGHRKSMWVSFDDARKEASAWEASIGPDALPQARLVRSAPSVSPAGDVMVSPSYVLSCSGSLHPTPQSASLPDSLSVVLLRHWDVPFPDVVSLDAGAIDRFVSCAEDLRSLRIVGSGRGASDDNGPTPKAQTLVTLDVELATGKLRAREEFQPFPQGHDEICPTVGGSFGRRGWAFVRLAGGAGVGRIDVTSRESDVFEQSGAIFSQPAVLGTMNAEYWLAAFRVEGATGRSSVCFFDSERLTLGPRFEVELPSEFSDPGRTLWVADLDGLTT